MEPQKLKTLSNESKASDPGSVALSHKKLRAMHPVLYGIRGFLRRKKVKFPERLNIEEHLQNGDSRAAVVMSLSPLLVAAYSDDLDCVAMLKFPDNFVTQYALTTGTRLLTVNTYRRAEAFDRDLIIGPRRVRWQGFSPFIAEFLSADIEKINARKAMIGEAEWALTKQLGEAYLRAMPGVARDGRPLAAGRPALVPGKA